MPSKKSACFCSSKGYVAQKSNQTITFKVLSDKYYLMTLYENENTLHRFITSKGEEAFHDRYEEAIENIKSEFGRRYTMIIGGKNVKASESFVHTSPIDTRIILAYFPSGTAKHVHQAIKAGKKAFESWGKTDYKERVEFCRIAIDIMNRRKFELGSMAFLWKWQE